MERQLDAFGRLERVAGPQDTLDAPTVTLEYAPRAAPAYAVSTNLLPGTSGVRIVTFADGLLRVIQTKKTAEVARAGGEKTTLGWAVTGHQRFDIMGRVAARGQAFFQAGTSYAFARGEPLRPTISVSDVLGRPVTVIAADGATTRSEYGFATPPGSPYLRAMERSADALGSLKVSYSDAGNHVVAAEERVQGRSLTTLFGYNAFGELERVQDAAGNVTSVRYDLLGNRLSLTRPDSGTTTFAYDPASHLVRRTDAKGLITSYDYDYERLIGIAYGDARQNVTYLYGAPEAPGRTAGRIREIVDAAGRETRTYDELGQVATTTRHLKPLRPGDTWRTFVTSFTFDSFGRMSSLVYPDGERLDYGYDAGGLVKTATGTRAATQWSPAQVEVYLKAMTYDEFEQRVFARLGNDVTTGL
jgi:YD repeat-containing protein